MNLTLVQQDKILEEYLSSSPPKIHKKK